MERRQHSRVAERTLGFTGEPKDASDRRQVSSEMVSPGPSNVQEDRVGDKVRKKPGAETTAPEYMSLWHSALLAAMVTTALAIVSAGMVFFLSGGDTTSRLVLGLPQTIESFFWRNQKTEVRAFPNGKKARSLIEQAASRHEKDQTEPRSREFGVKYREEEARPVGEELRGNRSHEATEEKDKDADYERGILESLPTRVVAVRKGDTIHRILKRQFGKSAKILIGAVRELNPEIEDLDWIQVGQKVRLPLNLDVAKEIQTTRGRSGLTIREKMGTSEEQSGEESL